MKIIGKRINHKEMKSMIGDTLYLIKAAGICLVPISCLIIGIRIGENNKWEFTTDMDDIIAPNEPLFLNIKSLRRYAKKTYPNYKLDK